MPDDVSKRTIQGELEDHLHTFNFHTNGFYPGEDRPLTLGAYMGVIHYDRVEAAMKALPDRDKWLIGAEVWDHDFKSTGSPTFGILAGEIRRQVEKLWTLKPASN